MYSLSTFAMGLNVLEEDEELCLELTRPVWAAASVANDLQSWDKEYLLAQKQPDSDMVNAVWVMMKQHSVDVETAKELCHQKVKEFVAEYVQTLEYNKIRDDIPETVRIFVEAMQYMISGNLVWGNQCPRYYPEKKLTKLQLARMDELGYPAVQNQLRNINNIEIVLTHDLPDLSRAVSARLQRRIGDHFVLWANRFDADN